MMTGLLAARLGGLAPLGLAELESVAALLIRRDRKYIVPTAVAAELVDRLALGARVLEIDGLRRFRYESVYFDTPDRASYLAAARRRPRRSKVRTRSYLDAGRSLLEIKTRGPRGRTVKERLERPIELRHSLGPTGRAFVARCPLVGGDVAALAPALTTTYSRATLLVGDGAARLTLDSDVEARTPDGHVVVLAGMVIVETKSAGPPSEADRLLWSLGHRPT
ncbi:MAG: polyphosphate polymerase domain-containing protein, partial [Chloroflexi bacterium]|nr:polyphosphate polymerase domain-containing protein [Chloroflexota bacterium]